MRFETWHLFFTDVPAIRIGGIGRFWIYLLAIKSEEYGPPEDEMFELFNRRGTSILKYFVSFLIIENFPFSIGILICNVGTYFSTI